MSADELREIVMPEPGERVVCVPQCSYHLTDLAERDGLVGLPASVVDRYTTKQYGAPYWLPYHRYEPGRGYALLVIRDGVIRKGPQNWDSSD